MCSVLLSDLYQTTDNFTKVVFGLSGVISLNTTYLTLVRPGQAATLVALYSLLRNSGAAIGAVVIDPLVKAEGFGWCFTSLAIVDLLSTVMAIVSLLKGRSWRKQLEDKGKSKDISRDILRVEGP